MGKFAEADHPIRETNFPIQNVTTTPSPLHPLTPRVRDLLASMTIAEKAGQMNQARIGDDGIEELIAAGGVGSLICASTAFAGNEEQDRPSSQWLNDLQRIAVERSRLGIPFTAGRDVIHGHRAVGPIPLGQAAAWSPELVRRMARAMAREAVADGIRWTFTPMVDIGRDPRWGRVAEGFGEDPWLASRLTEAAVRGIQEDDGDGTAMAACAKHFVGYGAAEGGRDYHVSEISEYALWNVYLPTFIAAIRAGVASMMSAFQSFGGMPAAGNRRLLTEILREKLGFDGVVVTDWNAVGELVAHRVAETREAATALAANAGADMDMVTGAFVEFLPKLVESGFVPEARLDEAVGRILAVKERFGLFDDPYPDEAAAARDHLRVDHVETALEIARKSVVLLENNHNVLPLRKTGVRYLVGGPLANAARAMLGTWCLDGRTEDVVTPLTAFREKLADPRNAMTSELVDELLPHARFCEAVVLFLGESDARSGEANSLATLELPAGQSALVDSLRSVGIPIVAVVFAGRPLDLSALSGVDAVVYCWHPGISGGRCVADVLFGDENPSGKLPITLPRSVGHVPQYYAQLSTGRPTDITDRYSDRRYRDNLDDPRYPFGFGRSYTTFELRNVIVTPETIPVGGTATVRVAVRNTGTLVGETVVQCYVRDEFSAHTRPVRELRGFERISLQPGEAREVTFELGAEELGYFSPTGKWLVEPGEFTVWCGEDSTATLSASLTVTA